MKRKKGEVNENTNRCEPFHPKNIVFGVGTCMKSNFKSQKNEAF